jgi:hypothetical protein
VEIQQPVPVLHPGERPEDPKAAEVWDKELDRHVEYLMTKRERLTEEETKTLSREVGHFLKNR